MLGHDRFTVTPRRGELIVFDKLARPLVDHVLLPFPPRRPRASSSSPTVYGNVMLGPTADDIESKDDTLVDRRGHRPPARRRRRGSCPSCWARR